MVDVRAFCHGRLAPISKSVTLPLTQVAIDSPPMQTCTVLMQIAAVDSTNSLQPTGTKPSIMRILFF